MLTILFSRHTGMQARQTLERNPPQDTSIRSSSTSFCAWRRPTSGFDWSSAEDQIDRPAMDAARLVDAIHRHLQADHRCLAAGRRRPGERLQRADLERLFPGEGRAPRRRHQHARPKNPASPSDQSGGELPFRCTRSLHRPCSIFWSLAPPCSALPAFLPFDVPHASDSWLRVENRRPRNGRRTPPAQATADREERREAGSSDERLQVRTPIITQPRYRPPSDNASKGRFDGDRRPRFSLPTGSRRTILKIGWPMARGVAGHDRCVLERE